MNESPKYNREIGEWSFNFSVSVARLATKLDAAGIPVSVCNQFLRAGTSVGANVHEGKASATVREYCRYLAIALRSTSEAQYWARLLVAAYNVQLAELKEIISDAAEMKKVLSTIIIKLKNKDSKMLVKEVAYTYNGTEVLEVSESPQS